MGKHRRGRARTTGRRNVAPAAALFLLGGTALVGAALGVDERDAPAAGAATPPPPTTGIDPVAALTPGREQAPAPAPVPAPAPTPAPGSADDLTGIWSGELDDPETTTTPVRLTGSAAGGGGAGVRVELPDLGCRYEGTAAPGGSAELALVGEPRDQCVDTARIVLSPVPDERLRYDLVESCDGDDCGPRRASGVLSRES